MQPRPLTYMWNVQQIQHVCNCFLKHKTSDLLCILEFGIYQPVFKDNFDSFAKHGVISVQLGTRNKFQMTVKVARLLTNNKHYAFFSYWICPNQSEDWRDLKPGCKIFAKCTQKIEKN